MKRTIFPPIFELKKKKKNYHQFFYRNSIIPAFFLESPNNSRIYFPRFSEITRPSIERALAALDTVNQNVSDAVDCRYLYFICLEQAERGFIKHHPLLMSPNVRSELDLRIGAVFTRFQTLRLQKLFPAHLADKLVSYGSCQFPTLGFVVERFKVLFF